MIPAKIARLRGNTPRKASPGAVSAIKWTTSHRFRTCSKHRPLILFRAKGILVESCLSFTRFHSAALHSKSNNFGLKLAGHPSSYLTARLFRCCGRRLTPLLPASTGRLRTIRSDHLTCAFELSSCGFPAAGCWNGLRLLAGLRITDEPSILKS